MGRKRAQVNGLHAQAPACSGNPKARYRLSENAGLANQPRHHPGQLVIMGNRRLGVQLGHTGAIWPEGHKHRGHPRRARGVAIGRRIPHQQRARRIAPGAAHGLAQVLWVRFAHRKRIGAGKGMKGIQNPKPTHQKPRQPFGLVGADRNAVASPTQPLDRGHRTGI